MNHTPAVSGRRAFLPDMTPEKIGAKDFEQVLLDAAEREERAGRLTMGRYGVMATMIKGQWMPNESLPDFEGDLAGGRHFIIEAKTCSHASFPMERKSLKPRQVSHMIRRSKMGVPCFLVIHFNARDLTTGPQPGITVAIPVHHSNPRWQRYVDAYAKAKREKEPVESQGSISRSSAQEMGQLVPWRDTRLSRKFLPDLLSFLDPSASASGAMETPSLF